MASTDGGSQKCPSKSYPPCYFGAKANVQETVPFQHTSEFPSMKKTSRNHSEQLLVGLQRLHWVSPIPQICPLISTTYRNNLKPWLRSITISPLWRCNFPLFHFMKSSFNPSGQPRHRSSQSISSLLQIHKKQMGSN